MTNSLKTETVITNLDEHEDTEMLRSIAECSSIEERKKLMRSHLENVFESDGEGDKIIDVSAHYESPHIKVGMFENIISKLISP